MSELILPAELESPPEVLLVPGAGLDKAGQLTDHSQARADASVVICDQYPSIGLVIFSGHNSPLTDRGAPRTSTSPTEASGMHERAASRGLREVRVEREEYSRSLIGNIALSGRLITPGQHVGVVTDSTSLPRTREIIDRVWGEYFDVTIFTLPEDTSRLRQLQEAISTVIMRATLRHVQPGRYGEALAQSERFHRLATPAARVMRSTLYRHHPSAS
jgi:hypothetical protein